MKKKITYRESGVDIDEGARLVELIKPLTRSTMRREVMAGIGGFGALFNGCFRRYREPVLVSSTDGVGTKLKIAFMADRHDTVGIDLVAMCVNDIVTCGAEPLFFLDYFATAGLKAEKGREVIKGVARGCREAGCALIGGETAEMPGFYQKGEYDLAGFAVGVVEKKNIVDGTRIRPGDIIIGLPSSGLHSNGYSLARRIIFDRLKLTLDDKPKGLRKTVQSELLTPTRIYVGTILTLQKRFRLRGSVHLTGGGLIENIPRVLPGGCKAIIHRGSWPLPPVFTLLRGGGPVSDKEMFRTFNCGIGMVLIVAKREAQDVMASLKRQRERAFIIGEIQERRGKEGAVEFL
ncbi:MAG: phosphoribosylformylglycinamidine cyclo-ligase [Thermodesulfobacteriota bacterium]